MTHIDAFKQKLNNKSEPSSSSADEVLNALEQTLLEQKEYHRLFDARMMRVRRRMELPLTQPASINGVPAEKEAEFREAYMAVAREVGKLFLEDHALADAWAYFRTIGDPAPVKQALEELAAPTESGSQLDDLISLALYEGAHIVLGLRLLLRSHGTCNTITAMGQLMSQMTPAERNQSAALMVKHLYTDRSAEPAAADSAANDSEAVPALVSGRHEEITPDRKTPRTACSRPLNCIF